MSLTPAFLPDALSPDACDRLIAALAGTPMKDAGLVGSVADHQLRRAEIAWLDDLADGDGVMQAMIRLVSGVNRDQFGFDLTDFGESAQIARYGAERQGHFGWHADIGSGTWAARRKLTVVVQLSPPADYDGGTLEIWPDAGVISAPRARGLATVFPSFQLHRVTPVTRGERFSLTLWSHGPHFR